MLDVLVQVPRGLPVVFAGPLLTARTTTPMTLLHRTQNTPTAATPPVPRTQPGALVSGQGPRSVAWVPISLAITLDSGRIRPRRSTTGNASDKGVCLGYLLSRILVTLPHSGAHSLVQRTGAKAHQILGR